MFINKFNFYIEGYSGPETGNNETKEFLLTYDNCNEIKKLYSWANIKEVSWRYHTANSNNTTRKMGNELIIKNY